MVRERRLFATRHRTALVQAVNVLHVSVLWHEMIGRTGFYKP